MKSMIRLAVVSILFVGIRLIAAENLHITARPVSPAPVIDGKLNEAEWNRAQYAEKYTILNTTNKSMPPAYVTVLYDNDNLYVGVICKTTNSAALKAVKGGENVEENIFQDETIEVMIDPGTGGNEYLQVAVNAVGFRFDAWVSGKGNKCDLSWEGDWPAAADIGDGEWSCELKIPFVLLGGKEGATAPWRINVCRHTLEPAGYSSLAGDDSFNVPDKFAFLNGMTKILAVSQMPVFKVLNPAVEINLRDGKMYCVVRAVVTNISAGAGKAAVYLDEKRENNERSRVASAEIALRGFEGGELVIDSPSELVPVDGNSNLWQPDKSLMIVVADSNSKGVYNKQPFDWPFIKPIQLSVSDQTKPELKCETGFSKDGKGNKSGKILITLENIEGGGKTPPREYPLADGVVTADFQADKLPAGRLLARAIVKDAGGKAICTNELVFMHLSKAPEQLNNLVCRLEKGKLKLGKSGAKEIVFENPRDGWVWVKLGYKPAWAGALMRRILGKWGANSGAEGSVSIAFGAEEWLKIKAGGEAETMRRLPGGTHRLSVLTTMDGAIDYEIRSVPQITFSGIQFMDPGGPQERPYRVNRAATITYNNWAWLKSNILKNFNVITSTGKSRKGDTEYYAPYIKDWRARGGKWLATCNVSWCKTPAEVCKEEWGPLMEDPLLDGITIDEFQLRPGFQKYIDHAPVWNAAIELIRENPKCEGKLIYAFNTAACTRHIVTLMETLQKTGYKNAMEIYINDCATEEEMQEAINKYLICGVGETWRKHFPTSLENMVVYLCPCNSVSASWHKHAGVNFNVFLDHQFHALANNPAFDGLGGVACWFATYMNQEMLEWWGKLCRHYLIEGNKELLSQDPYILSHLRNPGFEEGATAWSFVPAVQDSIKVIPFSGTKVIKNIKKNPYVMVPEGDKVLWIKRSGGKANVISQVIKGLTPGRLYSLEFFTADAQNPGQNQVVPVSITIEGAKVLAERSVNEVFSIYRWEEKTDNQYWTRHCRVFQATAEEGKLLFQTGTLDTESGNAEGQEIVLDFVGLQPYGGK